MNITEADFDAELMKSIPKLLPLRPPKYGISVREYAVHNGCSMRVARAHLDKLVKEGVLKVEEMRDGKKMTGNVYTKAKR